MSVRVCGDLLVPNDLDAVRVTAFDASGEAVVVGVLPLLACPEAGLTHLPVTRILGSLDGEHLIQVQALEDEVEIARVEVRARLDGTTEIPVVLDKRCIGIDCPLGQTCIGGPDGGPVACEVIPFADEAPMDCTPYPGGGPSLGDPAEHCGVEP